MKLAVTATVSKCAIKTNSFQLLHRVGGPPEGFAITLVTLVTIVKLITLITSVTLVMLIS